MLLVPELYGLVRGTAKFNTFADEVLREARLLHSLRHPNIVQLRGVTMHPEHGHMQWLVTELADHGSLEKWVAERDRLTLEELLDLLRSVMRALVYLHSRTPAVLHRDIKPANVLVFKSLGGGIVWKLGRHRQGAAVDAARTHNGARHADVYGEGPSRRCVRRQGGCVQYGHHGRGARRAARGHRRLRAGQRQHEVRSSAPHRAGGGRVCSTGRGVSVAVGGGAGLQCHQG
jgi:hypothetical protein